MILRWISHLPLPFLYGLSNLLYVIVYYFFRYRYQVVKDNLTSSFPEKSETEVNVLIKQFYRNFCDYMVETLKAISITVKELDRRVIFKNPEVMEAYLSNNTSVLALTSRKS